MSSCRKLKKCCSFIEKYKGLKLKEIYTQNTEEFCRETTLHGMKYVANNELRPSERCFFGLSIITVIVLVTYLIARVYDKWITTPVIVGIKPEPTFIANEPFPAVTICNLNQALDDIAQNFSINSTEYTMLQLLCKRYVTPIAVKSIINWNNVENFIVNISQPCEDLFLNCRFGGKTYNCSDLFYPLVTDEGLCCIFNMLHPKYMYVTKNPLPIGTFFDRTTTTAIDWYSEKGYPHNLPVHYYPRKIPGVGQSVGLSVKIDVQEDKYYCSSSNSIGFKFALHSPNETPNVHETGIFVEPGKETNIRIAPEKTESDPDLRGIHHKYRRCLFHDEGRLKYFAHYTQRNCEMECVAKMSLKYCGCVAYFMPKIYNNVKVCSINEAQCTRAVRLGIYNITTSCLDDCLPGCFELNYHVDSFSTKLARTRSMQSGQRVDNKTLSYVHKNEAVVHMYFKDNSFRSNIQTEFVSTSDFLSSIGGLMGLFIGFSFLSIAECIYYAIIRPYRSVRQYQQTLDSEFNTGKIRSSLARSQYRQKLLQKRYKNMFAKTGVLNEGKPKVPYTIAYAYEGDSKVEYHYPYYE